MKKTHKLTQWATLLLTVSGMAALPSSLTAAFTDSGALTGSGSTVTANAGSSGIVSGTWYDSSGAYAWFASGSGQITGSNATLYTTTGGASSGGLYASGVGSAIDGRQLRIVVVAGYGIHAINGARIAAVDLNIESAAAQAGVRATGSSYVTIGGGTVTTGGSGNSYGVTASNSGTLIASDLYIHTTGTRGLGAVAAEGSYVELNNVMMRCDNISEGALVPYSTGIMVVNNSQVTSSGDGVQINGNASLAINNSAIITTGTGMVLQVGDSSVIINGGTLASSGGELLQVGGTAVSDVILGNVDVANAGNIITTSDFSGTGNVTVSGGSGLHGDITNSGSGALTVNLDHSTLTGDAANQGDGTLTIILDHNSVGTGGFNGGNLITGTDSVWTFDKDSRGNYGENNGVWNIGDYDVTFDNMTHTGTVNINVNSDTGDGGSIFVTGTADGEGTIHIDTTGNGQLNPNDVLPSIVSGDGTEHWQWDPIDWGIDTIIKDGDHFIKSGVNPAGAVLNSSVAIQQAMWFAQQNSLLKRMGELRYGTRASRPPAGGTPALHKLIDNLWLRSYGQQLNIGSQVAGKAYEQLIYGVDLGTDHKFTISADSDLYLGVYAGYGRSDLDYRTPGTDGELNSYYGGLYATWLHSSGFYIDATVKAASVDNDLKAPYSGSQLTANYSDVNIGGSIEIGKKFAFADDWFIEPQFQVNYLHILAEDYAAGPMNITASDLDALQLRIGSLFGRSIKLTNSGVLQPYIKVSGVETISSGGAIRNGYQSTRANTDGARAELGGGLIWQLDADNQLHLDYEASFGDKYDKPWGLTAGYRHQ
ncbi:MAG: autotransporter outer membrane beta-barrel domain-containing protein, partial [Verrucomicrobiales bacterium]|nr:autotransporter outer membrane beta-barrel domain-containing protein [Verrucomicrobiales bacterium]